MGKMWTSAGDEQKFLEKLFRDKKINCTMKPATVQSQYPLFQGFSAAVFRKHWGLTKQMFDTCKHSSIYEYIIMFLSGIIS